MAITDYDFGGVHFGPRVTDLVPVIGPGQLLQGVRHVPYSDFNVLDLGGRGERHYSAQIKVATIHRVEIEALLGEVRALTVAGSVFTDAVLVKLDNPQMTPLGEYTFYDADWIIGGYAFP